MAWSSRALPIPRVLEVGEALGGYYALSERAFGTFLDSLDGPDFQRALSALFAALDAAGSVELSDSSGYGMWRADGNAPFGTWREALLAIADDRPTPPSAARWVSRREANAQACVCPRLDSPIEEPPTNGRAIQL